MEWIGGGNAGDLWPRAGRLFAVAPAHTFQVLAGAIDPGRELDADTHAVGELLSPGDEFGCTFDLGDSWRRQCVVDGRRRVRTRAW